MAFLGQFGSFLPFYPQTTQEIKIEKKKKNPEDIILHMGTKNHDNMLYCSWDMACDGCDLYFSFCIFLMMYASWDMECYRHIFLSFWAIFCPFTPLTTLKTKIWKNIQNCWRCYPFTYMYHKWRWYDQGFIQALTDFRLPVVKTWSQIEFRNSILYTKKKKSNKNCLDCMERALFILFLHLGVILWHWFSK